MKQWLLLSHVRLIYWLPSLFLCYGNPRSGISAGACSWSGVLPGFAHKASGGTCDGQGQDRVWTFYCHIQWLVLFPVNQGFYCIDSTKNSNCSSKCALLAVLLHNTSSLQRYEEAFHSNSIQFFSSHQLGVLKFNSIQTLRGLNVKSMG